MAQFEKPAAFDMCASEVVQAYLSAFGQGNIGEAVALLDEEVVWHVDGDVNVATVGLLRGKAQVKRWLESFSRYFQPQEFIISDLIAHKETVLVLGRFRHLVLSTGNTVGSDMVIHFNVSRSGITRYQIFEDSALLSRAFNPSDKWQQQEIKNQWHPLSLPGTRRGRNAIFCSWAVCRTGYFCRAARRIEPILSLYCHGYAGARAKRL